MYGGYHKNEYFANRYALIQLSKMCNNIFYSCHAIKSTVMVLLLPFHYPIVSVIFPIIYPFNFNLIFLDLVSFACFEIAVLLIDHTIPHPSLTEGKRMRKVVEMFCLLHGLPTKFQ